MKNVPLRKVLMILALTVLSANAQVTYLDTLSKAYAGGPGFTASIKNGMPFTTGPLTYQLNSITADFDFVAGALYAELYLANTGTHLPTGGSLVSFSNGGLVGRLATFTPSSTFYLQPTTEYVLVMNGASSGYRWTQTNRSNGYDVAAGSGWSFPAGYDYYDGSAWSTNPVYADYLLRASISASAIPEPSAYAALLSLAALGLAAWRAARCRRRLL